MKNGIDVNVNTVIEMVDFCKFVGLSVEEYLGKLDLESANNSSSYN